jgi:PPM family protein phosphatase
LPIHVRTPSSARLLLRGLDVPVNLTVSARTDPGLVRPFNEDSFVVADLTSGDVLHEPYVASELKVGERGVLLAVSDGLGGHAAGEVASALVIDSLWRSLSRSIPEDPWQVDDIVEEAAQQANHAVWKAAHQPGLERMGATLTAAFLHGRCAHIVEVGDSRAYLLRGGVIQQVTHDQSYVQLLLDKGVPPRDAHRTPLASMVLQAMGTKPDVKVALGRLALRHGDRLVLCSDGLWNKLGAAEMQAAIVWSRQLDAACNAMVDLALQRGGDDNITAIVAEMSGDLLPLRAGESIDDTLEVVREYRIDAL